MQRLRIIATKPINSRLSRSLLKNGVTGDHDRRKSPGSPPARLDSWNAIGRGETGETTATAAAAAPALVAATNRALKF